VQGDISLVLSALLISHYLIVTTRRYASAVYAVVVCPFVRPFICPSQAGTVPKRLNVAS